MDSYNVAAEKSAFRMCLYNDRPKWIERFTAEEQGTAKQTSHLTLPTGLSKDCKTKLGAKQIYHPDATLAECTKEVEMAGVAVQWGHFLLRLPGLPTLLVVLDSSGLGTPL